LALVEEGSGGVLQFNRANDEEAKIMNLSVEDILDDLHTLERELAAFESRYQVLSEDFFALYQHGRVEDSLDIHEWAGLYKAKLNLKESLLV
jgi:hypothetical protein